MRVEGLPLIFALYSQLSRFVPASKSQDCLTFVFFLVARHNTREFDSALTPTSVELFQRAQLKLNNAVINPKL